MPYTHSVRRWIPWILLASGCSSTPVEPRVTDVPTTDVVDAATSDVVMADDVTSDVVAQDTATPDVVTAPDVVAPLDVVTTPDVVTAPDVVATPDVVTTPDVVVPADAGAPRDFTRVGAYTTRVWNGSIPGVTGTARVYYPVPRAGERYPLVVFAHGFQLNVGNYEQLLQHVASWGYVVASVDYANSLLGTDHRNVALALTNARTRFATSTAGTFPEMASVDATRAVTMGHSLGGKGAIMALLDDSNFVAGVALDPVDDNPAPGGTVSVTTPSIAPERMPSLRRPLALFGGTQSRCIFLGTACAPEASNYAQFAASAPAGAQLAVWPLFQFGHGDFVDTTCGIACVTCASGAAPLTSRVSALRGLSVAFLERHTRGDLAAQSYIDGAARADLVARSILWDGRAATLPACR